MAQLEHVYKQQRYVFLVFKQLLGAFHGMQAELDVGTPALDLQAAGQVHVVQHERKRAEVLMELAN